MSNLNVDKTKNNETQKSNDFGLLLVTARQAQNLTIDNITERLKIPGRIIVALEKSDLTALPESIFTQGYIRAYARFLDIPEDSVLTAYKRALPHGSRQGLKSSSSMPNETNSQSPLVKLVSILLLLAGVVAAIYAGYQYYQEKADIMDSELEAKEGVFTGNSLDSPGKKTRLDIKQNVRLSEDGELLVGTEPTNDKVMDNKAGDGKTSPSLNPAANVITARSEDENSNIDSEASIDFATKNDKEKVEKRKPATKQEAVAKVDVIEFIAEEDAWLEVRDASSTRLFYNILKQGVSKSFEGRAPFRLSLGNARTTQVLINNIEVNMQRYIRPSNTAGVTISSEEGRVIFH